jgi:hypothetical protein
MIYTSIVSIYDGGFFGDTNHQIINIEKNQKSDKMFENSNLHEIKKRMKEFISNEKEKE